jgi:hypothetical protein
MRVTDWQKWTSAKKKIGFTLGGLGVFLSFGMDNSMLWGVIAVPVTLAGALIINSIRLNEW